MKKIFAVLIAALLTAALLSGCFGFGRPSIDVPNTQPGGDTAETTDAATEPPVVETDAPTDAPSDKIAFDYVKSMREEDFHYTPDGSSTAIDQVMTIPEILLDSEDAADANDEIREKWGKLIDDSVNNMNQGYPIYVYDVYYAAYLYQDVLSVYVHASYEGGNEEYGVYNFRVSTGDRLTPQAFFSVLGRDYDQALSVFEEKLGDYYAEKYGSMPGNEAEMKKTLDRSNLIATPFYVDNSGAVYAVPVVYAAVGGGRFAAIIQIY